MIQPANNPSHASISTQQSDIIAVKRRLKNVSFLVINQHKNDYSPAVKTLAFVATGVFIGGLGVVAYKNWDTLKIPLVKLFTPSNQPSPENELNEETIKTLQALQRYLDSQNNTDWTSLPSEFFMIMKVIAIVGLVAAAKLFPNSFLHKPIYTF